MPAAKSRAALERKERSARVTRATKETDITVALAVDGTGKATIDTGVPFLDHMLDSFARHGFFDLTVQARGDVAVDQHHTVEDVGLALGQALREALGDYLAGPNHVLPTGGSARFFSPLGTYHFVKRTSVVGASAAALRRLAPAVQTLAELEGYQAHAAAVRIRFQRPA